MIKVKIARQYGTPREPWVEIEFPITPDQWREKLCAIGSTGEYVIIDAISDNEFVAAMLRRHDSPTVQELNYIAVAMMDSWSPALASMYMLETNFYANWVEFINALCQADDIPYYTYDEPPGVSTWNCSKAEKFGYHQAYGKGLWDDLHNWYAEDYFDFEEYGRCASEDYNVVLFDDGYIDFDGGEIDLEYYTPEEIETDWENYYLGNVVIEDNDLAEQIVDLLVE